MRIYLSNDSGEKILEFNKVGDKYFIDDSEVFFRQVAGKRFYSLDNKTWNMVPKTVNAKKITVTNKQYDILKGFKPSGRGAVDFGSLITQMPGKVVKIMTKEGNTVKAGETLLILEAMKMENEIKTAIDAVVKSIHVSEGQSIETGHLMVELDTQES